MSIEYKYEMDINPSNFNRKLMCIEYPGLVKNVDKMVNTLGGLDNIGIAYGSKNRRVELRFRPDDFYCKPTCGERNSTAALLLKVKVKKKARDPNIPCSSKDADAPQTITFTTSLIGVVDTIYKFNNLCDFQYLPMASKDNVPGGKLENIYDKLRPNFLPSTSWLNESNTPFFLTPPLFSRFDSVHYYNAQKIKDNNVDATVIGRARKKRTAYGMFLNFRDEKIPEKPYAESLKMLRVKFLHDEPYNKMKQLFEERPVWSKNALTYHTEYTKDQLKYLLPTVAYYFLTGPWRVMWVRYGYDPRKIPESRIYQTFDYRLRTIGGLKNQISAKRNYSNCLLPYKNSPSSRPKVAMISRHSMARAYQAAREYGEREKIDESIYIFRPGMIPGYRQMFYQYCDVFVPEIQTMLARLPPVNAAESKCDNRNGWLPNEFDNRCREIVNNLVTAEFRKQMHNQQKRRHEKEQMNEESEEEIEDETMNETETDVIKTEEIEISDSEDGSDLVLDESEDESDALIDSDLEEAMKDENII